MGPARKILPNATPAQYKSWVKMKRQLQKRAERLLLHAKGTEEIQKMLEHSFHLIHPATVEALEAKLSRLKEPLKAFPIPP